MVPQITKGILIDILESENYVPDDGVGDDKMPIFGYHKQVRFLFRIPELGLFVPKIVHELQWYRSRYALQVFHPKQKKIVPIQVTSEVLLPYHKQRKITPIILAQYMLGWVDYENGGLIPFQTGQSAMFYLRKYGKGYSLSRYHFEFGNDNIIEPFDITTEKDFNAIYLSSIIAPE
jgi:hypothetical protein